MKMQQNMTKSLNDTWSDKLQTFVKSSLPEEPTLKLRMNVNIFFIWQANSSLEMHSPVEVVGKPTGGIAINCDSPLIGNVCVSAQVLFLCKTTKL